MNSRIILCKLCKPYRCVNLTISENTSLIWVINGILLNIAHPFMLYSLFLMKSHYFLQQRGLEAVIGGNELLLGSLASFIPPETKGGREAVVKKR